MALIEREIVVPASQQEAFDIVADFASCAVWDPGVTSASRRNDTALGLGAIYDVEVDFNGRRLPMVYEVTRWDPPSRVVLTGKGSTVSAVDDIAFEQVDGGTLIHYRADLRMRGLLAPLTPLLRKRFEALGDAAMDGMAQMFSDRQS